MKTDNTPALVFILCVTIFNITFFYFIQRNQVLDLQGSLNKTQIIIDTYKHLLEEVSEQKNDCINSTHVDYAAEEARYNLIYNQ